MISKGIVIFTFLLMIFNTNPTISESLNAIPEWSETSMNLVILNKIIQSILETATQIFMKFSELNSDGNLLDDFNPLITDEIESLNDEMMKKLNVVSTKFADYFSRTIIMHNIHQVIENMTTENRNALIRINILFDTSERLRKIIDIKNYSQEYQTTLFGDFVFSVFRGQESVSDILSAIHFTLIETSPAPTFAESFLRYLRNGYDEDNNCYRDLKTPQVSLYHVYLTLISAEIKGFLTIIHAYTIRRFLSHEKFNNELITVKNQSTARIADYMSATKKAMTTEIPAFRRCDPDSWIRDESFVELQHHGQTRIISERTYSTYCRQGCNSAPLLMDGGVKTYCEYVAHLLDICYSKEGQIDWIRRFGSEVWGHETKCNNFTHFPMVYGDRDPFTKNSCYYCICEYIRPLRVNVIAQNSEITNNMIVTGVKFVWINETLELRIKQGHLESGAFVRENDEWMQMQKYEYCILNATESTFVDIRLYDIKLPSQYVVTGIKFECIEARHFQIKIRGTRYNFTNGNLTIDDTQWFAFEKCFGESVRNASIRIDDSRYAKNNAVYDKSPAYIEFANTNYKIDVGQRTVPMLDAQPVAFSPAIPLSGVGLYYKGEEGYGGFVGLQVFPINLTEYFVLLSAA